MTKTKIALISSIVTTIIVLSATIPLCWYCFKCDEIDALIYIKTPSELSPTIFTGDPGTNKTCGDKINLDGEMLPGNIFRSHGWDTCKRNYRDFPMGIKEKHKNMIGVQINYAPMFNLELKEFHHNLDGLCLYEWEHVALGGGASAIFAKDKLYDIGPKISAQIKFYTK